MFQQSKKTFFEKTFESKKILLEHRNFFSCARADTHDKAIAAAQARDLEPLNST